MKVYKLLTRITVAAAVVTAVAASTASAYSELLVKMDGLKGSVPELVDFADKNPVTDSNNTVLVPARYLADNTGMFASWNQQIQTATISLYACSWGENNIERYAAELMKKADTYGLGLEPINITADFKMNNNDVVLKYNYRDTDGEVLSIGKTIDVGVSAQLVDDGTLMVPLEAAMKLFSLDFVWDSVNEDASVSIPDYVIAPSDMTFMADEVSAVKAEPASVITPSSATSVAVEENAPVNTDSSLGTYIGRFKITHYCTCSICNGGWGANTAWAGEIIPGQTIAVDPSIIPKMSWVYIDGYGYRRAEDCGGGIKGNHIDMAVANHALATSMGIVYADVYLAE